MTKKVREHKFLIRYTVASGEFECNLVAILIGGNEKELVFNYLYNFYGNGQCVHYDDYSFEYSTGNVIKKYCSVEITEDQYNTLKKLGQVR